MKPIQIDRNSIVLDDLANLNQNFDNLLNTKDSITYKNCNNLKINIDSTFNKLLIQSSNNIEIKVNKIISGIEIKKCKNIKIITSDNKPIYYLYIDNSDDITITINKKNFKSTEIDIIDSDKILFIDFNENNILKI